MSSALPNNCHRAYHFVAIAHRFIHFSAHPARSAECGEDKRDNLKLAFTLGCIVATPGALNAIEASGDSLFIYLRGHQFGDGSETDPHDRKKKLLTLE
jgi:hypothetical protein